jgi:hypothetical protein
VVHGIRKHLHSDKQTGLEAAAAGRRGAVTPQESTLRDKKCYRPLPAQRRTRQFNKYNTIILSLSGACHSEPQREESSNEGQQFLTTIRIQ